MRYLFFLAAPYVAHSQRCLVPGSLDWLVRLDGYVHAICFIGKENITLSVSNFLCDKGF